MYNIAKQPALYIFYNRFVLKSGIEATFVAQQIVTYFPAYFDELRYILPHCSIYSYYISYLDS